MFRVCPKCLSTDIRGTILDKFECNDCGLTGVLFPEITETELKELNEKTGK